MSIQIADKEGGILIGDDGKDILIGRQGNDVIFGGDGNDLAIGGGGLDIAVFSADYDESMLKEKHFLDESDTPDDGKDINLGMEVYVFGLDDSDDNFMAAMTALSDGIQELEKGASASDIVDSLNASLEFLGLAVEAKNVEGMDVIVLQLNELELGGFQTGELWMDDPNGLSPGEWDAEDFLVLTGLNLDPGDASVQSGEDFDTAVDILMNLDFLDSESGTNNVDALEVSPPYDILPGNGDSVLARVQDGNYFKGVGGGEANDEGVSRAAIAIVEQDASNSLDTALISTTELGADGNPGTYSLEHTEGEAVFFM